MGSISEKARLLARHAARLRAGAPAGSTAAPFDMALFTDERAGDPLDIVQELPTLPGVRLAVILRHYDTPDRGRMAQDLSRLCRQRRFHLLIGADAALAAHVGASGVHFPESQMAWIAGIRQARKDWVLSAACHDAAGLFRASKAGATVAFLSPVFPTASHPGAPTHGALRAHALAAAAGLPVMALGGITGKTAGKIKPGLFAGFGSIDGLSG